MQLHADAGLAELHVWGTPGSTYRGGSALIPALGGGRATSSVDQVTASWCGSIADNSDDEDDRLSLLRPVLSLAASVTGRCKPSCGVEEPHFSAGSCATGAQKYAAFAQAFMQQVRSICCCVTNFVFESCVSSHIMLSRMSAKPW